MKPIRILYVTGTLELGGYETLVRNWCERLHGNGFTCSVACILGKRGPYVKDLEQMGVPVHDADQAAGHFIWRLARVVRKENAELVHSQCAWSLPQQIMGARLGNQTPFLLSVQNTYRFGTRWQTLRRVWGLRPLLRYVPAIVGISAAVSQHAVRWLGVDPAKVRTIHSGIPTDRFLPAGPDRETLRRQLGLDPAGMLVVCVASLTPQKGHETLLQAAAELRHRRPAMQYLLVGSGPLLASLEQLAQQLGIADRVRFFGPRRDVAQILAASDIFALASNWEGFGLVVAEAGSTGLPVVASAVGGIPEIVEDGKTGLLVPPGNPQALAAALERLAARPEEARALGAAGRARIIEQFDIQLCADRHAALYRSVLPA